MTSTTDRVELNRQGRILVVDDEPKNRELLRDLLEVNGYAVIEAADGIAALEKVNAEVCDVILLDVMMPRLDGLEVCRRLKQAPLTAPIPVLLVIALADKEQRLEGIEAGANDYLTKPIDRRDVLLRVRNALYAKRLYDQVQEDLVKLRELETLRDNLTHLIIHDMRSPLMSILAYLEFALEHDVTQNCQILREDLSAARASSTRLAEMVTSILDVSRLEAGQMPLDLREGDLNQLAQQALSLLGGLIAGRDVTVRPCPGDAKVRCDLSLIERVIVNLVGKALEHTPPNAAIVVAVSADAEFVRVDVRDMGPGIPPEYHERIFEKFGQAEGRKDGPKRSTGLGLTFCRLAVEAHGGRIGVESQVGKGSTFWFILPLSFSLNDNSR